MTTYTCALWYGYHHVAQFSLCVDEAEAVEEAYYMSERGDGGAVGIQYEDGRFVSVSDWTALLEFQKQCHLEEEAACKANALKPKPPTYEVEVPWGVGRAAERVLTSTPPPPWLGKQ